MVFIFTLLYHILEILGNKKSSSLVTLNCFPNPHKTIANIPTAIAYVKDKLTLIEVTYPEGSDPSYFYRACYKDTSILFHNMKTASFTSSQEISSA